ncbi:SURF1 family protein [Arthrobacter sp. B1805]|uniref:SURF1 family protein n=1 Tax=Arthrobacter sp. B1805 TaxID=2058892 RepID=UPI0015E35349|nr:SURF1 family protein [Arthrobacter sp. B1805]
MLKTALKPRWILMLILAMAIAAVFVLLSQWQFSSSRDAPPPAPSATENVRPLTEVLQPLTPLYSSTADQMVSLDGSFLSGTRVLVQNRLSEGEDGLWVVEAFAVEGSDGDPEPGVGGAVIPVVLGWVPEADEAAAIEEQQGPASVVGRLLPPEAPEVQRPVEGQVPTLATAELTNLWDRESYSAFVVASEVTVGGTDVPFAEGMRQVVVGPQPQETPINWLNIFYAIEWVVFAGFAFFLWWRLVADDYRRSLEDAADAAEAAQAEGADRRPDASVVVTGAGPSTHASTDPTSDTERSAHSD